MPGIKPGMTPGPRYAFRMTDTALSLRIYVDADACPVKEEIYKVAARLNVPVTMVAGGFIRGALRWVITRRTPGALPACFVSMFEIFPRAILL